jgi:TM2 domain-containing membrane protein YozV
MHLQSQNRNGVGLVMPWVFGCAQSGECITTWYQEEQIMNKKLTALLLSALVLPGLGQLYLGRKVVGGILLVLVNIVLLLALFVLLRGLSPVIASQIAGGAITITPSEVLKTLEGETGFGKTVLGAFFLVWAFSVVDIIRFKEKK